MKADIREHALVGFVHHMLYPECAQSEKNHVDTLLRMARREDISTYDCCIPFGREARAALVPALRSLNKPFTYALHLLPLRKISLGSLVLEERAIARMVAADQIALAAAAGATAFLFPAGADIPEDRTLARANFYDFCLWACEEAGARGMSVLLEPFDMDMDKRYLYGSCMDSAELVSRVRARGYAMGIELDMGHIPLMHEEIGPAVRDCGDLIRRVHLGNCLTADTSSPWYGDIHPPIGLPGGEHDTAELSSFLQALWDAGYFRLNQPAEMALEVRPFPGMTAEETIADQYRRLDAAWAMVAR